MTLPLPRELETPRLRLRIARAEDAEAVFDAEQESLELLRPWFWWTHPEHTRARCAAWAASRAEAWATGEEFSFLLFSKNEQRLLGCAWLNALDSISLRASLGYWLRRGCEGRGFASEATGAVVRWGFANLNLQRIEIVAAVANSRSRRLAERLGAQFEGIARNRLRVAQTSQDACIYGLIPADLA